MVSIGLLAFVPSAGAASFFTLTIEESIESTGYGEVLCKEGSGEATFCEEEYESGTKLTLVPVPESESEFAGFKNGKGSASACNGLKTPCTFKITANSSVEAVFNLIMRTFAVHVSGEGTVFCEVELGAPEECEAGGEYPLGTAITVSATPEIGSEFLGFKNGKGSLEVEECVGLGPCSFSLEANSTLDAAFGPIMHALMIAKAGTGQGTVTCNGTTCASSYPEESEVTLKATPTPGSAFAGWSGEGCSGTGSCVLTIEKDATVTATFQAAAETTPLPIPTPEVEGRAKAGATAKVKAGKAQVKLTCSGGPCQGTLKLTAKLRLGGNRKAVAIGKSHFSLAAGTSRTLKVKLSAAALRELGKTRSLAVRAGGSGVAGAPVRLKLIG